MTRASPIRHKVRAHTREGTRVDKYMRGDGKAPTAPRSASVGGGTRWRVSRGGESLVVGAGDIVAGLRRGIDNLSSGDKTVTVNRV